MRQECRVRRCRQTLHVEGELYATETVHQTGERLQAISGSSAEPDPKVLFKFGAEYKVGHCAAAFALCSAM